MSARHFDSSLPRWITFVAIILSAHFDFDLPSPPLESTWREVSALAASSSSVVSHSAVGDARAKHTNSTLTSSFVSSVYFLQLTPQFWQSSFF